MRNERVQAPDAKGIILRSLTGDGILAEGSTVPSDATAGYSPGCVFFKRAGATGLGFYVNRGSATSCSFKPIDAAGLDLSTLTTSVTELNLLTGLLATAAEINRMAQLSTRVVSLTASTTLTAALHSDKMLVLNAAGGLTVTLPAPTGTGVRFPISIGTALTAASYIISSTGANIFGGILQNNDTAQGTGFQAPIITNASGITTITLNGSTQGGRKGDWLIIEDRLAAGYQIMGGQLNASGTEATPFS